MHHVPVIMIIHSNLTDTAHTIVIINLAVITVVGVVHILQAVEAPVEDPRFGITMDTTMMISGVMMDMLNGTTMDTMMMISGVMTDMLNGTTMDTMMMISGT